jgi:chromatin assembly factor 1 subunit B
MPIAVIGNIHYAPINDIAWCSNDVLIACSSDGYCSVMTVGDTTLIGERLPNEMIED